jgi:hypothetical protein
VEVIMPVAATLARPPVGSHAAPFVTLGSRQFMVLVCWLLLYSVLFVILLTPFIDRHLARLDVQAAEEAFGFRLGLVDEGQIQDWHIVEVAPGGRLAAAGFRVGDVPSQKDSAGIFGLAAMLREAAAGRRACVTVWNEEPFSGRRELCLEGVPDRP